MKLLWGVKSFEWCQALAADFSTERILLTHLLSDCSYYRKYACVQIRSVNRVTKKNLFSI